MSDLVGNPEDRFSRDQAQIKVTIDKILNYTMFISRIEALNCFNM